MSDERTLLATYLNDHLAGATSALELLTHLTHAYAGQEIAWFAEALHEQVTEDRHTLEQLAAGLGIAPSPLRAAVAWAGEKMARLKLRLDDPSLRGLHLIESLDALSIGIEGKRLLWAALLAASETSPALRGPDYATLMKRADAQRADVEQRRLAAARATFV